MRIISLNLNGIRSATTKGALQWLGLQQADVICVQELKAQEADLTDAHLSVIHNDRVMKGHFYAAQKKYTRCVVKHCKVKKINQNEKQSCVRKHCRKEDDAYSQAAFL